MRGIRPIEIAECCICGEKFDKMKMERVFTGRVKYMCKECYNNGHRQVSARRTEFESSTRGKQIISESDKNK